MFVRFGALSPSRAVFPSASGLSSFPCFLVSLFPGFLVSWFPRFPVFSFPRFPVSSFPRFPISSFPRFLVSSYPVSDSVPFPVPFHISDSVPRSSILDRTSFQFPFRTPFPSRLPRGSASRCFTLCSRAALLYIEGSA